MAATKTKLIPLKRVQLEHPEWPYSPWSTGDLIRRQELACIRVGSRIFVTSELLEEFIESHRSAS